MLSKVRQGSEIIIEQGDRPIAVVTPSRPAGRMISEVPIVICSLTVAEIGHGIYRAATPETRDPRRVFLDDLKATVPIHPVTAATLELGYAAGRIQPYPRPRGFIHL